MTRVHKLGHSGQGREMVGLTISKGQTQEKRQRMENQPEPEVKPAFVIIGAQHAREVRSFFFFFLPMFAYSGLMDFL